MPTAAPVTLVPGSALPAIPSAMSGMVEQTPLTDILGSLGAVPGEIADEQKARAQTQLIQQQVAEAKQKNAQTRLQYLIGAANANKNLLTDPNFQKSVDATLSEAGLPPAPYTDQQVAGAPDGTTQRSLDLQALTPAKTLNDLNFQTFQALQEMQPAVRAATAKAMNLQVPDEWLNAPAQLSAPQADVVQREFDNLLGQVGQGKLSVDQFMAQVQAWRPRLLSAGIDPVTLDQIVNNPALVSAVGVQTQAKIDQLKALGLSVTDRAQAAVTNANSMEVLRTAQAKFWNERGVLLPQELQEKIRHDQALETQAQSRLQIAMTNAQTNANSKTVGDLKSALASAQTMQKNADENYNAALKTAQSAIDSGTGVSPALVQQLQDAKKQKDNVDALVGQVNAQLPKLNAAALQHYYGNQRPITAVNGQDPSKTTTFDPSKAVRRGTITSGPNQGKTVLLMPDGKTYLLDGTPLGQ